MTSRDARLALNLAPAVRHDGNGGVADGLTHPAGLTARVRAHPDAPPEADRCAADGLAAVLELRAAARALFARAVRPGGPGPADAARPLPVPEARGA